MAEIVILGAGLTGLSTAYHLEQAGFFDYKIYEKNDRPGGLLQSAICDGFTFDHTGHLLHINDEYFRSFLNTVTNIEKDFDFIKRKSSIHTHGTMTEFPFQMNLASMPIDVITECIEGFATRNKSIKNPKNFHEWVLKHFGAGIGKHFFFPYNSKILSYDVKKVHPSWTGRFVPRTTLKEVIQGALQTDATKKVGYNSSFYYPKKGGIEFLISKLAQTITQPIQTNHKVVHVDARSKTIFFENGHHENYKTLVTTMPLNKLLEELTEPSHSSLKSAADKLECNAVANLNLGINSLDVGDKHWIYFPEKKFPFYRLGFWHNISPQSAPAGHAAIYAEASYLPKNTSPRKIKNILDICRTKTLEFFGLNTKNIVVEKVLHLNHAYVIYNMWREKNLSKVLEKLKLYSIHSVGRFGEWKYSSMQEAILDGKATAETIISPAKHVPTSKIIPAVTVSNLPHPVEKQKRKDKQA